MAPNNAPSALATIRWIAKGSVELSGDCITTIVAMTAQYASGIRTSRASNTASVAAIVVRIACAIDGRFSFFALQSFIACNHFPTQMLRASTDEQTESDFILMVANLPA